VYLEGGLCSIKDQWILDLSTLNENLQSWFLTFSMNKVVPLFVLWGIWHYRNKILFENFFRNDFGLCSRIVLAIKEIPCATRGDNLGFLMNLVYFGERPLGFLLELLVVVSVVLELF
jgi:hypothetical protein